MREPVLRRKAANMTRTMARQIKTPAERIQSGHVFAARDGNDTDAPFTNGFSGTGWSKPSYGVPPENPIGRRNRGFSDRGWIPSLACTRPTFFSFQHSAAASVGAQHSSLRSLLFGIISPR